MEYWTEWKGGNLVVGRHGRGSIGYFKPVRERVGGRDYDTGAVLYSADYQYFVYGVKHSVHPIIPFEEALRLAGSKPAPAAEPVVEAQPAAPRLDPFEGQKCYKCGGSIYSNGFCANCGRDNAPSE